MSGLADLLSPERLPGLAGDGTEYQKGQDIYNNGGAQCGQLGPLQISGSVRDALVDDLPDKTYAVTIAANEAGDALQTVMCGCEQGVGIFNLCRHCIALALIAHRDMPKIESI